MIKEIQALIKMFSALIRGDEMCVEVYLVSIWRQKLATDWKRTLFQLRKIHRLNNQGMKWFTLTFEKEIQFLSQQISTYI